MATLVAPLVSGVVGATSGTAEFYVRGTSTTASVYSDADAQTAVTTHALDSNGGVVRYVNESVDVIVKNSSGTTVREFTWEVAAESVQVTNASFTGTDPETGQTTAGGRTTLDEILTLVATSFGTTNFELLKDGETTAVKLKDAFSAVDSSLPFFDVTEYGATGDGTTNDYADILEAYDAAVAAGGGILFFPAGTYAIGTTLTIASQKVSLMGVGGNASIIKQTTASSTPIVVSDSDRDQSIVGLAIDHSGNATHGIQLTDSSAAGPRIVACRISADFTNGITDATQRGAIIERCTISVRDAASAKGVLNSGAQCTQVIGTDIIFPTTSSAGTYYGLYAGSANGAIRSTDNRFDCSGLSGSAIGDAHFSAAASYFSIRGAWMSGANGRCYGAGTGASVFEEGTMGLVTTGPTLFDTSGGGPAWKAASTTVPFTQWIGTRESGSVATTVNGTGYTPSAMNFAHHFVTHASGASMAFNNPSTTTLYVGARMVIVYLNQTGGAITPTFDSAYSYNTVASVGNNEVSVYSTVWDGTNFVQVNDQGFTY